jgi:tartrate dehydratase alpha subunit/fumarate hydratase class I-like protein
MAATMPMITPALRWSGDDDNVLPSVTATVVSDMKGMKVCPPITIVIGVLRDKVTVEKEALEVRGLSSMKKSRD